MAAAHFDDNEDPLCPLCEQSIRGGEHQNLITDLRTLKTQAEAAQTLLADACRRIEQDVRNTADPIVPERLMRVERFAVKASIQDQLRATFVNASIVAGTLPGFSKIAQDAIDAAFETVEEFEFGVSQSEIKGGENVTRVRPVS